MTYSLMVSKGAGRQTLSAGFPLISKSNRLGKVGVCKCPSVTNFHAKTKYLPSSDSNHLSQTEVLHFHRKS